MTSKHLIGQNGEIDVESLKMIGLLYGNSVHKDQVITQISVERVDLFKLSVLYIGDLYLDSLSKPVASNNPYQTLVDDPLYKYL